MAVILSEISRVTLGTVQFGLDYGIANRRGKPNATTVRALLRRAFEGGITTLDTAASYGNSEEILGDALAATGLAGQMAIITKIPPIPENLDAETASDHSTDDFIVENLRRSFSRLRVERLAGVLFHAEKDAERLAKGGRTRIKRRIERELGAGRIGGLGVSLDSNRQENAALDAEMVQIPVNVLDHRFDAFLGQAKKRGIILFARSVLLQGLLVMDDRLIPTRLAEIIPHRQKLALLAQEAGITLRELAFRFTMAAPGVTSILTGVDSLEQLEENLQLASFGPLPNDLFLKVQRAIPLLEERLVRPSLWNR